MDVQTIVAGAALFLAGLLVGRATAPKERTVTIHERRPPRLAVVGDPTADAAADAEIEACLQRGNKIEAIKRYREAYGTGLKEAKDAVEAIEARRGT